MTTKNPKPHKVDSKREPCRICNTSHHQTIDILQNKIVLDSITSSLDLIIFPDTRLSKRICAVCLALVRFFSDFKKICYDTQNDLWQMDANLVKDRSEEVCQILNKVKQVTTYNSPQVVKPDIMIVPKVKPKSPKILTHHTTQTPASPSQNFLNNHQLIDQEGQVTGMPGMEEYTTEEPESMEDTPKQELVDEETDDDDDFIGTDLIQEDFTEDFDIDLNNMDDSEEEIKDQKPCDTQQEQDSVTSDNEAPSEKNTMEVDIIDIPQQILPPHQTLPKILYQCQQCTKSFLKLQELIDHRKSHPPTAQKCGYCRIEFPVDTIANHVIQCALLNKRKKQNSSPGEMVETVQPPKVFIKPNVSVIHCGVCSKRFQSLTEYKTHFQEHVTT